MALYKEVICLHLKFLFDIYLCLESASDS